MNRIKTIAFALFALAVVLTAPAGAQFYNTPHPCNSTPDRKLLTLSYPFPNTNGERRSFDALVYRPQNMTSEETPLAAVIWSHGGGYGGVQPMKAWAEATTQACYISISLGHKEETAVRNKFCPNKSADCEEVFAQAVKPLDISRMVAWIEDQYGPIPIAVGGHSGGAHSTMTVAGAKRLVGDGIPIEGIIEGLEDARPDAFIALSPSGPNYAGFFGAGFLKPATSWDSVTRPMLTATGDGDNKCQSHPVGCSEDKTPWNRQAPHALMPGTADGAGPKVQLYIRDTNTFHNSFRLSDSKCDTKGGPVPQAKCNDIMMHLKSVVIAFVDESLRGVSEARHYLSGNYIQNASKDLDVTLSRK